MRFSDYLRIAFTNLRKRKLRTALTVFAVMIGAILIALMVSLGVGAQRYITAQLTALSVADVISVEPASSGDVAAVVMGATGFGAPQQVQAGQQNPYVNLPSMTGSDVERIAAIDGVDEVQPFVLIMANWVQLDRDEDRYQVQVLASPQYEIVQRRLAAGRPFGPGEEGVAVVAYAFLNAWELDNPDEALGRTITVRVPAGYQINFMRAGEVESRDYAFEIVGVFEPSILSTEVSVSIADGIEMGRYFAQSDDAYTADDMGMALSVHVSDPARVEEVAAAIEDAGHYAASTPEDSAGAVAAGFRVLEAVLSIFGLIALGVSSLGIINTLIMAIYERTREIGVMKAVGASRRTIWLLFVVEAAAIGFVGGLSGVAVAWIAGVLINAISHLTFLQDYRSFDISAFPLWLVLLVVALSTGVALVAGLLPATRAASLDPIEALRYE